MPRKSPNHGGKRPGAGRKSTKHEYVDDGLESPLQFMLKQMRNASNSLTFRADMAKAAAPYCSAKLLSQSIDVDGDVTIQLVSYLDPDKNTAD